MKKMKKWELLKKAYETYPAGTKCTWGGETIISTGIFSFGTNYQSNFIIDSNNHSVFDGDEWAEIVHKPNELYKVLLFENTEVPVVVTENYIDVKTSNADWPGNLVMLCLLCRYRTLKG